MIPDQFTKAEKNEIRRLTALAYERELAAAAEALHLQFERWHRGEINVFALNVEIHKFHDGIARDLFKQYVMGDEFPSLASAFAREIIKESEPPASLLPALRTMRHHFDRPKKDDQTA